MSVIAILWSRNVRASHLLAVCIAAALLSAAAAGAENPTFSTWRAHTDIGLLLQRRVISSLPFDPGITLHLALGHENIPIRHSLRISADTTIDTSDLILATTDYAGDLLPGWTSSYSSFVTFPKATPRGNVYMGLIADDLGQVEESDETNNRTRLAFSFQVPLINSI